MAYKKSLVTNEERELKRSLEIQAFFLCDPEKQSGKGYGKQMFKHLLLLAESERAASLHFCVHKDWTQLVKFLKHWGFKEKSTEGSHLLYMRPLGSRRSRARADYEPQQVGTAKRQRLDLSFCSWRL